MISVVLMEPKTPGNVGAIARVMKNFSFTHLVLINPRCDYLCEEAVKRAKHAYNVLKNVEVIRKNELNKFDYVIGTTSVLGTDYNIIRNPITPKQLAIKLCRLTNRKIALLFGRDDSGLTNEEILNCDFVVTIPATQKYPALNISHAVAIILYEIFNKIEQKKITDITPISRKEKEVIMKLINNILKRLEFSTPEKRKTQEKVWKRIIGKALLTKREAYALLGFLRKVEKLK